MSRRAAIRPQYSWALAMGSNLVDPSFTLKLCYLEAPSVRCDLDSTVCLGHIRLQDGPCSLFVWRGPLKVSARGYRPSGFLLRGVQPVDCLDTVHDGGSSCLLHSVLLDVGVGLAPTAIIDRADLVTFINGCQGPWAEFLGSAFTSACCFRLGEWSFHHAQINVFNKGLSDLGCKAFCRGVVFSSHRQEEILAH